MDNYFESVTNLAKCKLKRDCTHILKHPKVLPCGNTACFDCIRRMIAENNSKIKCDFDSCNQTHAISNPNDLLTNLIIEEALQNNVHILADSVLNNIEAELKFFEGTIFEPVLNISKGIYYYFIFEDCSEFDKMKKLIEESFKSIEMRIAVRINSLKYELENIEKCFYEIVKRNQEHFTDEFEKQHEAHKDKCKQVIDKIKHELHRTVIFTEKLQRNIYSGEDILAKLRTYYSDVKYHLQQYSFKPEQWSQPITSIGVITSAENDIVYKLMQITEHEMVGLNPSIKSVCGLCNLDNERLVVTDPRGNKILIFDLHYNLLSEIEEISNEVFNRPYAICYDNCDTIFLCDYDNNRILVLDKNLTRIKKIIFKYQQFKGPMDICFYKDLFYVLDKSGIKKFNREGELIDEMVMFKDGCFKDINGKQKFAHPVRISVVKDLFAILDSWDTIYIYTHDGILNQELDDYKIDSFISVDTYLLALSHDGILICYRQNTKIKNDNYYYSKCFERKICKKKGNWSSNMCFFNNDLVTTAYLEKLLEIYHKED